MEFERLQKIIAEEFDIAPAEVNKKQVFTKDLGADSLQLLELQIKICKEFDIEITDEMAAAVKTVDDAYNIVMSSLIQRG